MAVGAYDTTESSTQGGSYNNKYRDSRIFPPYSALLWDPKISYYGARVEDQNSIASYILDTPLSFGSGFGGHISINHLLVEAAEQELVSATKYADRKRQQHQLAERYAAANLGYEPIDFEKMGGLEIGEFEFLKGIFILVDEW